MSLLPVAVVDAEVIMALLCPTFLVDAAGRT